MGSTTFSGPVTSQNGFIGGMSGGVATPSSFQSPTSTSAILGAKANAINTTNKIVGTTVYNTTTKTFYVAQGTADTSTWIDSADGTTTITPS